VPRQGKPKVIYTNKTVPAAAEQTHQNGHILVELGNQSDPSFQLQAGTDVAEWARCRSVMHQHYWGGKQAFHSTTAAHSSEQYIPVWPQEMQKAHVDTISLLLRLWVFIWLLGVSTRWNPCSQMPWNPCLQTPWKSLANYSGLAGPTMELHALKGQRALLDVSCTKWKRSETDGQPRELWICLNPGIACGVEKWEAAIAARPQTPRPVGKPRKLLLLLRQAQERMPLGQAI